MLRKASIRMGFVLVLVLLIVLVLISLFALADCGEMHTGSPASRTVNAVPTATPANAGAIVTPTPAHTVIAATATFEVPPTDLCREYLHLSVLYGEMEGEAVATSYRCHSATIDSTGQSPARSPDLVVRRGTPIHLQLAVEQKPTAIDVRLYPGAGISASFLRWPEELPTHIEEVDSSQPEPSTRFQHLPQASPGPYSLVVKVTWGETVEVFYAISFTLEDAALPTSTRVQTATPMVTHTRELSPAPLTTPTPASPTLVLEPAPDEVKLDVVEQIGGHSLAVAVDQGRVYLGIGPRLVVLNDAFPLTESMSMGQSDVLPGIIQDVYLVDRLAYVAAGEAGLIVLDVTDSSSIRTIGIAPTPGDAQSVLVKPEDGLAYVASGGQLGPWKGGTLSIIDVSEPEMPEKVMTVQVSGYAYDVALTEHYAYATYADGVLVVDISDPAAPVEVVNVDLSQRARDVAIADGYAYVAGHGLQVIDVSDPTKPHQVSRLETRFPTDAVAVQGELAYLADTFCEMGHCGSTIYIVDVSDPTKPRQVNTWVTKSAVKDALVHEDALYLTSWEKGLQVVDVSDPANPHLLGEYATLPSVEAVAVSDGYAYVSDGAQSGLQVLDLGASRPRVRGTVESARWADGYAIVSGHAYVPVWVEGLRIVDVRASDAPREAAVVDLGMTEQAAVVGERAYVTIGYDGLAVLDVADPSMPRVLGELPLDGLAEGLAVAGDQAYVTVDDGEQNILYVIDVADPSQPAEMGQVALKGKGLNVALAPEADYAYVAIADCAFYLGIAQCSGGLQVMDVRDPSRPRTVVFVEVPGGAFGVAVRGDYAFVTAGNEGAWVVDVSDPENPRAVGWKDTAGRARNIVVVDDLVYVADGSGGLLVLSGER